MLRCIMLCYVILCYVTLYCVVLSYGTLRYIVRRCLCNVMSLWKAKNGESGN